jgi:class 3 adenylate cyclase/pimeloyl-ACP methyl ester carboxylesterase
VEKPRTRYGRSGDVFVAYQVFGEGPFDLVVIPGFLSNIEYGWEFESWRNYYGGLASFARVLLFDKRGTGISDPVPRAPSIEERIDDVRAVMDAAGSERAAVIGSGDGAAIAAVFAAAYPERTAALILSAPRVRGRWAPDYPWGDRGEPPSAADLAREMVGPEVVDEATAARLGGEENARLMQSYERLSASPTTFASLLRLNHALDVREVLSTIRAPTLVTHIAPPRQDGGDASDDAELFSEPVEQRRYDAGGIPGEPVGQSRYVAEVIPGARFVELPPSDPPVWARDSSAALTVFREFLIGAWQAGAWEPAEPDRMLATLLFTDIVNSTERAAELGDAGWRDLIHRHHALVRQELLRFRGREIDTAGDGFFASFDGPARAVRCASAIIAAVPELGLEVRAGVHTGECEIIDGKPGGLAVVVGSRIASVASSGSVLASNTVKDLVVGSGITFEDRGEHELKGVPGAWTLHAVVNAEPRD